MKDYFNPKKYTLIKTKTQIFPSKKNIKNQNIYVRLNPEYIKDNYPSNNTYIQAQAPTYIPYNIINNNISSNDKIYQKYFYINQRTTPLNYKNNQTYNNFNNINERNIKGGIRSPVADYIENQNLDKYNLEENDYKNSTTGFQILNRMKGKYNNNMNFKTSNNFNKISSRQKNNKKYISDYEINLVKNFIEIINKVIEKKKRKELFKNFFNNIKNYSKRKVYLNYINNLNNKEKSKYNEYKDMVYNYIKSKNSLPMSKIYNKVFKPEDKIKFKTINANKTINQTSKDNNNTSINDTYRKNEIKRVRQLQKKYGKIYEKKMKENISFEDRVKNYINHKTIESNSSINTDNSLRRQKLIYKKIGRTERNFHKMNLADKIHKTHKTNIDDLDNNNRITYKIYILKNIVTADKRIYVSINYISLDNKDKNKINNISFYDNDILDMSDKIVINYLGNKSKTNNTVRHRKKLSKIEEEIDDKLMNLSNIIRENKYAKRKEKNEDNEKSIKTIDANNSSNKKHIKKKIDSLKFKKVYLYNNNINKNNDDN